MQTTARSIMQTTASSIMQTSARPTLADVMTRCHTLGNIVFHLPTTSNKGLAGLLLEKCTGIPQSSACLDCDDGEVKLYPLKRLKRNGKYGKSGELVPKETVAITMLDTEKLETTSWEDSKLKKKIAQLLFVAYLRDGDNITFKYMHHMCDTNPIHREYYDTFANDYRAIQEHYKTTGTITGRIGKHIQSRTKGAGGGAPKTRAFYFRPGVMSSLEKIAIHHS